MLTVDGRALTAWTFDANNVLAWDNEAGYAAWLQFMALPGGPVFMGSLRPVDDAEGVPQGGARPCDRVSDPNPGCHLGSLRPVEDAEACRRAVRTLLIGYWNLYPICYLEKG